MSELLGVRVVETTGLDDRVLTLTQAASAPSLGRLVDRQFGGLVLTGQGIAASARGFRQTGVSFPVLTEPGRVREEVATESDPFGCSTADSLFPRTLDNFLEGQRSIGATLVLTPTGQVGSQDSATLKAVIREANRIADDDVVTMVPVRPSWLSSSHLKHFKAVLATSQHPVALCLVESNGNPLVARKDTVAGYSSLFAEVPNVIAYRSDLSGLGAIASGGSAAVIGLLPSHRRAAIAGKKGYSSNPTDRSPHVLVPELMRFVRTSRMQREWFASTQPLTCGLPCCSGQAIDRFQNPNEALVHNHVALTSMAQDLLTLPNDQRWAWWIGRLRAAELAHLELGQRIKQDIALPDDITAWLKLAG